MAVLGGTDFKLRSSTHNDPYASLAFTAAAAYTAGDMRGLEDIIGVIVSTVAIGDTAVFVYQAAKIVVPCVEVTSGNLADFNEGCKVYFDSTNNEVTPTSGSNTLCGIVTLAPSTGDEVVEIHLMGALGIVS